MTTEPLHFSSPQCSRWAVSGRLRQMSFPPSTWNGQGAAYGNTAFATAEITLDLTLLQNPLNGTLLDTFAAPAGSSIFDDRLGGRFRKWNIHSNRFRRV